MTPDEKKTVRRRRLSRALGLDQPAAEHSSEELAGYVARNYRWNYAVTLVEGVAFWLSMSLLSYSTIIPLFVSKISTGTLAIGAAAMLAQGGWYFAQLFSANLVERLPRRKPFVINAGLILERLPMWLLVIPALLAGQWALLALILFLVFFAWRELGGGVVAPALEDMIARVIPVRTRGSYWGLTSALGALAGVGASAIGAWLLASYAFPVGFVAIFLMAAIATTVGWVFLAQTREAAQPPRSQRQSQREYFAGLPDFIRNDRAFLRYLEAQGLLSLAGMGLAFVAIAAVRRWAVSDGTVGLYTAALLFGQGMGNIAFGVLADRKGHKLSLEFSAAFFAIAYALALLAPSAEWYYFVFFLLGIGNGAQMVSRVLVAMEFGTPERRPTYLGLSNTTAGLVSMLGPLLAAWLAGINYNLLFAISTGISLAALAAMHWWAQDPRWMAGDGPV